MPDVQYRCVSCPFWASKTGHCHLNPPPPLEVDTGLPVVAPPTPAATSFCSNHPQWQKDFLTDSWLSAFRAVVDEARKRLPEAMDEVLKKQMELGIPGAVFPILTPGPTMAPLGADDEETNG